MIQSYKKQFKIADQYDAIVIGSGLGGLSTAAILGKQGKRVLILERHYTPGGYTHVFKRPGYEWDVGVHYIGDMGEPPRFVRKLFDYVSDGKLQWADMGEIYDRVFIGDENFDFPKGLDNLKKMLHERFPGEGKAIDSYFDLVFQVSASNRNYFLDKALWPILSKTIGAYLRKGYLKFASKTTLEVLSELTSNPKLIKVLTAQYGDYGLPPGKSSFAMHAALVKHYFNGGYFPVGGSSVICEKINELIEKQGGQILVKAEVDQILIRQNKAIGVRMFDGKELFAPLIISDAGIPVTFSKLLPPESISQHSLRQKLEKLEASVAHVCLYAGFNGSPEKLKLPKANYWIYPEKGSHDELFEAFQKDYTCELPMVYISFPAAKDPSWNERYPGKSTVDIITMMPYEVFEKWENTKWKKRGAEYEALKKSISDRLLKVLFRMEPQLREYLDCYELSSPLTTRNFMNYDRGELYGVNHNPERFKQDFLRPQTGIKGLYLTGQDIVSVGVVGALASGLLTSSVILGKNLMNEILTSN